MLTSRFREIVKSNCHEPPSEAQANAFQEWIRTVSVNDVVLAMGEQAHYDLRSLARRLTPNPPSVLDLADARGYIRQVLYWYPLVDTSVYGSYDTEDIHSHFGFIVTRALIGNPYFATHFVLDQDQRAQKAGESLFREGADNIIKPADIHSVRQSSTKPSLSIRVVFPPSCAEMQVYDRQTGGIKEVIVSSTERRTVELAGLLATLDRGRFEQSIDELSEDCFLSKSNVELKRLTAMAQEIHSNP